MVRNLSPVLHRELENLDKDPDSRRAAMKALKSYVKGLNSKDIPIFLTRVSETKEPGSSSGECTISLFEVLVRSHGRNIVPHIDNIMDLIIKTLSSSVGSFALHQACSKVVPAITRYGIDPLLSENEKTRIICSLCKPLSDALMGSQESAASGAALCLRALVESDNWRCASVDLVNEVCLKVAGALEETQTQTNSHMGLVMALSKHNSLITDAYARSLIRSGLQILTAGVIERNSQKRLSAIQMINFLMKCVDSRSISSEIANIVDVMEKCQNDQMPFVRGAAFEALQTAKIIAGQEGSRHEACSSPFLGSNCDRRIDRKNSRVDRDIADAEGSGSPAEFPSPETQTDDYFADNGTLADSPLSIGQSSCNVEYARHAKRRLWNNHISSVSAILKEGFFRQAGSGSDGSNVCFEQFRNGELSETHSEHSETSSGSAQPSARNVVMGSSTLSSQRSRPQITADDVKVYSTPRKLIQSLQNSSDANSGGFERQHTRMLMSPTSGEVKWNPTMALNEADHSHYLNHEFKGRSNRSMRRLNKQQNIWDAELVMSGTDLTSSPGDVLTDSAHKALCRAGCEDKSRVRAVKTKRSRYGKAALIFVCCLSMIYLAIILFVIWIDNDEVFFDVVPT